MAKYRITAPDGNAYQIEGPEGATDEQVRAEVIRQNPHLGQFGKAQKTDMSAPEMALRAVANAPASSLELASNIMKPFAEPVETAQELYGLGKSVLGKMGITDASPEKANQVGQYFKNRYGSVQNAMKSFASDPAGVLSDASSVLMGGGAIAAKLPGMARAGEMAITAGRAMSPSSLAVGAVKAPAKIASTGFGFSTGAGGRAVEEAAKAGFEGGERGAQFAAQMRGTAPVTDVVESIKPALENMRRERSAAYRAGMGDISKDKTVLDFSNIDKSVADVRSTGIYKGQVIDKSAAEAWQKINDQVKQWEKLDPAEFHTPEGLDALKKSLGDIRDSYQHGTPARLAADKAYNAVRSEIVKQAPSYSGVMKDYETASDLLKEIEQSLSLNPKAAIDTKVRKLQSLLRNNANTNYGRRVELGEMLAEKGATNLFPQLAGQAMSSWSPRGMTGALSGAGALYNTIQGITPTGVMMAAATSPRLVGEAAYKAGQVVGTPVKLAQMLAKYGTELASQKPELAMAIDRAKRMGGKIDPAVATNLAYQLSLMERAKEGQP